MWILRWLFSILVFVIIIIFSTHNFHGVEVHGADSKTIELPLFLLVFVSFGLGVIAFIPAALLHNLKLWMELRKLRAQFNELNSRVTNFFLDQTDKINIETNPTSNPTWRERLRSLITNKIEPEVHTSTTDSDIPPIA
jgi:uncharacterized integral membrane protein